MGVKYLSRCPRASMEDQKHLRWRWEGPRKGRSSWRRCARPCGEGVPLPQQGILETGPPEPGSPTSPWSLQLLLTPSVPGSSRTVLQAPPPPAQVTDGQQAHHLTLREHLPENSLKEISSKRAQNLEKQPKRLSKRGGRECKEGWRCARAAGLRSVLGQGCMGRHPRALAAQRAPSALRHTGPLSSGSF